MDSRIRDLLGNSELVRIVRRLTDRPAPSLLFGGNVKPLSAEPIARLRTQGCECPDWGKIYATEGFAPRAVSRTRFEGKCVLGRFIETHPLADGVRFPSGIYNATLVNCEVGDNALIRDVSLLANYVIEDSALISSVGEMIASSHPTFGNGEEIALGMETGERAIRAYAELDLDVADALVREAKGSKLRKSYEEFLHRYLELIALGKGYVGPKATVRVCRRLSDVFVGEAATVENALALVNTTILSSAEEPVHIGDGVEIRHSLIQWGCGVTGGALVESSVLTEHSHIGRHGKVAHSLLGPNTGIGEGEVTSCLLGPFVGFHHQSLLIAALWPSGKGNVGYGANVGSNHTSKAPDQEIWPGEGMFFGLGTNIKFPANFARAPYGIIATGVTTLPQKVEFPFSLINSPSRVYEGISPGFNEIIPGWVLSDNLYALARNEAKFRDRNKARRSELRFEVFRPETIDPVKEARARLLTAPPKKPTRPGETVLYLDKDIPGLGKNYMLETSRTEAVEAYSFCLRFYALRGLYRRLLAIEAAEGGVGDIEAVLRESADSLDWAHELLTLQEELPGRPVRQLLPMWVEHHRHYAEAVRISKARDDERGVRIIPDYADFHSSAAEDKLVRRLAADQAEIEQRVGAWLKA